MQSQIYTLQYSIDVKLNEIFQVLLSDFIIDQNSFQTEQ